MAHFYGVGLFENELLALPILCLICYIIGFRLAYYLLLLGVTVNLRDFSLMIYI